MENRVKCLLIGALVFMSLGFLFYVIGFSTGHWLESDDRFIVESRFVRLGLWEACFEQWTYYKDYTGKTYNGCWWIFSYEYRPIWQWLNPEWFLAVQVVMTINLILSLVSLILLILYIIQCCPGRKSPKGMIILSVMLITSGVLSGICTLVFGAKSVIDRTWLENPDQNYLSWSFGMIVMAAFLTLFAGMCTLVAGMQVYLEKKYYQSPKPYSGYHIDAPPPNY